MKEAFTVGSRPVVRVGGGRLGGAVGVAWSSLTEIMLCFGFHDQPCKIHSTLMIFPFSADIFLFFDIAF